MKDYTNISATLQGKLIGECKLCPVDLFESYIDKINNTPDRELIFSEILKESALEEAKASKKRAENDVRLSKLDGVCLSWKDLFQIKNHETQAGSRLLKGNVSGETAKVIENSSFAGITSISRTHMTELAFSGLGINPSTATPPNSIRKELAPGGSSSGAGVSTALNLCSASIGSDTGGSVRVPAAWNNIVGLKTSHGLLSLDGVMPLCPSFDTVGPLTKTVEDAFEIYAILAGHKIGSAHKKPLKNQSFLVIETVALEGLDKNIGIQFENSLRKISDKGAKITRCKLDIVATGLALSPLLFAPEAYSIWGKLIESAPEIMFRPILERFRSGKDILAKDFLNAWQQLESLRRRFKEFTLPFDAILLPTTPLVPPITEKLLNDDNYFNENNLKALRNTRIANLFNQCCITIPTDTDFCGLSIMMPPKAEQKLISLAAEIELLF